MRLPSISRSDDALMMHRPTDQALERSAHILAIAVIDPDLLIAEAADEGRVLHLDAVVVASRCGVPAPEARVEALLLRAFWPVDVPLEQLVHATGGANAPPAQRWPV